MEWEGLGADYCMKKLLLSFLFTALVVIGFPTQAGAVTDIDDHWAKDYIQYLESEDIYNPSHSDNSAYKPDQKVSRAEFMRYVNRSFHFTEKTPASYADLNRDAWYNETIQIAEKYGYINGVGNNKMDPMGDITREQVAVIIGRIYKLDPGKVLPSDLRFTDNQDISPWSAGYIRAAVDKGFIEGYKDGTFKPKKTITRAEVSKILYFYLGSSLSETGKAYHGSDLKGDTDNVTISESCTLTDAIIKGDLYLTEGLGAAAVTLSGVTVEGSIILSGGTVNMVNTSSDQVVVSSTLGRLLQATATGVSNIKQTWVKSVSTLYETSLNGGDGFQKVIVDGDARVSLTLDAELDELDLCGDATVSTTANSVIHQLTTRKLAAVTGYGTIVHADILTNGVSMSNSIKVNSYTLAEGVSAKIDGQQVSSSADTSITPKELTVDGSDLSSLGDTVSLTLPKGILVSSATCDGKTIAASTAYRSDNDGLYLLTSYLSSLSDGQHTLDFHLSNGQSASVEVTVKNAEMANKTDASLTFDRYYLSEDFTDRFLTLDSVSFKSDIKSVVLGLGSLDYEFDEEKGALKLRRGVLGQLPAGVYTVTVNLKNGDQKTIQLTITDSAPETDTILLAEYDTYKPAEPCFSLELSGRTVKEVNAVRNETRKMLHVGKDYHISTRGLTLSMSLLEDYRVREMLVPFYVTLSDQTIITLVIDYI